jgi:hypothetical protein
VKNSPKMPNPFFDQNKYISSTVLKRRPKILADFLIFKKTAQRNYRTKGEKLRNLVTLQPSHQCLIKFGIKSFFFSATIKYLIASVIYLHTTSRLGIYVDMYLCRGPAVRSVIISLYYRNSVSRNVPSFDNQLSAWAHEINWKTFTIVTRRYLPT